MRRRYIVTTKNATGNIGIGLFDRLRWQDVTISIADQGGRYAERYRRTHHITFIDLALAAAATELDAALATLNVRHFPTFPDLQPPY